MHGSLAAAVEQAVAGDGDAFRVLVESHSRGVFRLAYRMTGNEHDAEEVVQETFLRAYRRLRDFQSRSQFGTWLTRIAVNCAFDLMRTRRRHDQRREMEGRETADLLRLLPAEEPSPEQAAAGAEIQLRVSRALEELSPAERAAFVLRHFEGRSIEEIGRALDISAGATKNTVFRAVRKLRQSLAPLAPASPR